MPTFSACLRGSVPCMTSAQWITQFEAAEKKNAKETAENEDCRRKDWQLRIRGALERQKRSIIRECYCFF